jgi:LmbE family N-acetylglucosaminyl deacetylase
MTARSADLEPPRRALAIGAHPDDIEFGCGATVAKWARRGTDVDLLILTDGSKGTWNEADDLEALVALRRTEARAAAAALGVREVYFLDLVDGELESGIREREQVCHRIRASRPEVVLGHDPWKRYRLHPDHRHAGWLTIDAIVAARDPHFFPGTGSHHRPDALMLFEADEPDHVENIDAGFAAKIDALMCHRSQWLSTMGIDENSDAASEQREAFTARCREAAERDGALGTGGLGEAFKILREL